MKSNGTKRQFRRLKNLRLVLVAHASEKSVNVKVVDAHIDVDAGTKLLLNINAQVVALAMATAMDEGKFLMCREDI